MIRVPFVSMLLVLSWKWYLFGACLWGLYLWDRLRDRRRAQSASDNAGLNVRRTSLRASRLGTVLVLFAFFISPPTQWILVAGAFLAMAALAWALDYGQSAQYDAQLRGPTGTPSPTRKAKSWKFGWMFFAALNILGFAVAVAKLGTHVQFLFLLVWGGGAGFLVGFGMCLWLSVRRKEKSGPATAD
jgi:hypothetical protein